MRERFLSSEHPIWNLFIKTHWMKGTKIYHLWANMLNAIRNEKTYRYKYIWWIWIKCNEKRLKFEWFYEDIKELYEKAEKEIEWKIFLCRKNIDKDFTKENIFFWTKKDSQDQNCKYVIWDWKKYTQTVLIKEIWMSYKNAQKVINEQWTKEQFENYKFNLVHRFEYEWEQLTAREIVNKTQTNINPKTVHDRLMYRWCTIEQALETSWLWNTSLYEKELLHFVLENYSWKIISNYRVHYWKWKSHEIDIYLPELELWIEYNWCYYHSTHEKKDSNCHFNKKVFFNKKWINLITIWEDEWLNKKKIVKSMILNKLWKSKKIYARNTEVVFLSQSEFDIFCDNNHIQWHWRKLWVLLWLKKWEELVCVMWFSKKENILERFCSMCWYNVVWWFSKLLKYYIKKYNPKSIISFAAWDVVSINNNVYNKNWFIAWKCNISYFYIKQVWLYKYERYHKSLFRKSKITKKFGYVFKEWETEYDAMKKLWYLRCFNSWIQKYVLHLD